MVVYTDINLRQTSASSSTCQRVTKACHRQAGILAYQIHDKMAYFFLFMSLIISYKQSFLYSVQPDFVTPRFSEFAHSESITADLWVRTSADLACRWFNIYLSRWLKPLTPLEKSRTHVETSSTQHLTKARQTTPQILPGIFWASVMLDVLRRLCAVRLLRPDKYCACNKAMRYRQFENFRYSSQTNTSDQC